MSQLLNKVLSYSTNELTVLHKRPETVATTNTTNKRKFFGKLPNYKAFQTSYKQNGNINRISSSLITPNSKLKQLSKQKNVNLQKMIKEEGLEEEQKLPNFVNIKSNLISSVCIKYKFCSICTNLAKYTCPRCGEYYCSLKCHNVHKEVACLKFDI